VQSMTTSCSRT